MIARSFVSVSPSAFLSAFISTLSSLSSLTSPLAALPPLAAALSIALLTSTAASAAEPPGDATAATEAWRTKRAADLVKPDGWLTVAGLSFLQPGVNTIGTDPASDIVLPANAAPATVGRLTLEQGRVWLDLASGVQAKANDQAVTGRTELRLANSAERRPADRIAVGRVIFHLHHSGDRVAVRLRDPESPLLKHFAGLRWFPIDPAWRITGRFVPYDAPRTVTVQNVLGDTEDSISPGEVEFTANGQTLRLVAFKAGERLSFVFRDATAGVDTYRIRFLSADAPDANGQVTLDFNRAYNPPCAYNPYTTCPLPPPQNRLKIAIAAGEKNYVAQHSDTSAATPEGTKRAGR